MTKTWLVLAAISGFLTVALGAFGAHAIKNVLDEYGKSIYQTAVQYQMFHTVALLAVGLCQHAFRETSFALAGWAFALGISLFSGSLYVLALTGQKWLGAITPFGGVAFLVGWIGLGIALLRVRG